MAAATGRLADVPPLAWQSGYAVTVVIAAEGYPASPRTGDIIKGLADADTQSRRLDRAGPGGVAALGRLKPGIKASTGPPGRLKHRR